MSTADEHPTPLVFDFSRLDEVTGNDEEFGRELVAEYVTNLEKLAADIEVAFLAASTSAVGSAAHGLKGSSMTVGADALGVACKRLELAAGTGDTQAIPDAYRRVKLEIVRLQPVIREWLDAA